ncbi:alpha/beta fold hydrolase [Rubrimonas cliftonensis]|uniref:Lysophospholipase, alpha-beta hydrolase superfamily n=1 Tax=Rubrimonas cliftonensis TaxID=89524 RepID=A0A1H4AED1_9RHOB|nr:alpha/beta fold hydrolase [Rubrimonas cliftonensis]SEA34236.1 Lysophospholipase, alpha-beta hydrolase superfamily [Rubrimonas cliftonensis]
MARAGPRGGTAAAPAPTGRRPAASRRAALAAAALALLAGCAGGGAAPLSVSQPSAAEAASAGPQRFALIDADGAPLVADRWPAEGGARVVLLGVHGFGDYGPSTFGGPAPDWAARGIEVVTYDQRGFGRNPSRGAWPGFEALTADFAAVAAQVAAAYPGLPLVAAGHSLGGAVTLAALGAGGAPEVDAAVLLAPATGESVGPFARAAAWTAAAVIPDRRWSGEGLVRLVPTDNAEALARLRADPAYLRGATAREVLGLMYAIERSGDVAARASLPVLVLHGEKDAVVPYDSVAPVAKALPRGETILYPDGWHLLLRDNQRARVWADVAAFALAQVRPAAIVPAPVVAMEVR